MVLARALGETYYNKETKYKNGKYYEKNALTIQRFLQSYFMSILEVKVEISIIRMHSYNQNTLKFPQ